jgi:hypothetical protein
MSGTVSVMSVGATHLNILGTVQLDHAGEKGEPIAGKPAALLCKLALSTDWKSVEVVMAGLWEDHQRNNLDQAVRLLKNNWVPISRKTDHIRLDLPRAAIDAHRFMDGVTSSLVEREPAFLPGMRLEAIDGLISMWREDPRVCHSKYLRRDLWGPLIRARDRLVRAIAKLPRETREGLECLDGFIALFPFDKELSVLREDAQDAKTRPRLLIVDDQQGPTLRSLLAGYDCTVISSIGRWEQLVDEGTLDFDGALVDMHLTVSMTDEYGKQILHYLLENTDIPALLMSVKPVGWSQALERRYGLVGVYYKDDERFPDIRPAVADLLKRKRRR